jgi:15-cis-phytoene synthase
MDLYTINSLKCSEITTKNYSTSFSMGIRTMPKKYRNAIYAIYGFVRFADEIVDTFHEYDKEKLLTDFRIQTNEAIDAGISTNPVLHSFQWVVNSYNIDRQLVTDFLDSMEMDLHKKSFSSAEYQRYIYGSAEVVGLMCLRVFYSDNDQAYERLLEPARKLGEAFQKVNFLRDMMADNVERGRIYFPNVDFSNFDNQIKCQIEEEISQDFLQAYQGIKDLHKDVRLGVFLAYNYYLELLKKIQRSDANLLMNSRFSVPKRRKLTLLLQTMFRHSFNIL